MIKPKFESSVFSLLRGRAISKLNRKKDASHKSRRGEIGKLSLPLAQFLELFPDTPRSEIEEYERELEGVRDAISATKESDQYSYIGVADLSLSWLQYMICRITKPEQIVETGVWIGGSSLTMLTALSKNQSGKLSSIDFPPFWKSKRVAIGSLVPAALHDRWDLYLGPSKSILRRRFERNTLDIFVHDSDHTYSNMMAEFTSAWDLLKEGGYLISDDSSDNDSVLDFAEQKGLKPHFFEREKGGTIALLRKQAG